MTQLTIPQTLDLALRHHQAGRLRQAEALYRQILTQQPDHADALHYLGLVARQTGRNDLAVDLIRRAIARQPDLPQAHYNLAVILEAVGRSDEAVAAYRQAIVLNPRAPETYFNLGNALNRQGQADQAIAIFQQAIALKPAFPEAFFNLGNVLNSKGQVDEAIAAFRQAIACKPAFLEAYLSLGSALQAKGRLAEAIAAFRQAVALRPELARAHFALGVALQAAAQLDPALAAYGQAIALKPDYAEAHNNRGVVLKGMGQVDAATAAFRQVVALKPDSAEAHYNLGNALQASGQLDEAIAAFRQAISLKSNYFEAYGSLGISLANNGLLDEAIPEIHRAISLNPHPANAEGFTNLLYALYHHPDSTAMQLLETTRQWARQQPVVTPGYSPNRDRNPTRKLKIGYVSGSFVMSADAHFTLPLLAHHDHAQIEVFGYTRASRHDEFTQRLQAHCDHWIDIRQLGNQQAVELMRSHELDILVNVSNPADPCRRLFASRMAPIQMLWLIFASCTSGLTTVDYRISDPYVDPPGMDESCYSEQTLRLPETAWCYDPLADSLPVEPLPALANGFITFGSLHRLVKLNPQVIAAWAQILCAVPNSRLHILAVAGSARQRLLDRLQELGVDGGRIEFIGKLPRRDYLRQYQRLDILLDTFPFAGHTTVLDSLWMGVPVVTAAGETLVSRAAASALENMQLGDLIGRTPEQYVQIAVKLANDLPRLKELRATLRPRMEASPLMDAARFVRNLESVYRQVWHTYCTTTAMMGVS